MVDLEFQNLYTVWGMNVIMILITIKIYQDNHYHL